jgi:hypothetical protein
MLFKFMRVRKDPLRCKFLDFSLAIRVPVGKLKTMNFERGVNLISGCELGTDTHQSSMYGVRLTRIGRPV